jgi:hypothetical protein
MIYIDMISIDVYMVSIEIYDIYMNSQLCKDLHIRKKHLYLIF